MVGAKSTSLEGIARWMGYIMVFGFHYGVPSFGRIFDVCHYRGVCLRVPSWVGIHLKVSWDIADRKLAGRSLLLQMLQDPFSLFLSSVMSSVTGQIDLSIRIRALRL